MYAYQARIAPSHTGEDGLQTLVSLVSLMQDCSQLWLEGEPELTAFLEENGVAMMIAARQLDVARYPRFGESVDVTTGVYGCNKLLGYRNTVVTGEDGARCAVSRSVGVFVDRATGKPVRLPGEIAQALARDAEVPLACSGKKIRVPEGETHTRPSLFARRSDIDYNKHVNNACYIRMACDCLPDGGRYGQVRVEYRTPARLGDEIVPVVTAGEGGCVVVELLDLDGKPFAVVELSHPFEA